MSEIASLLQQIPTDQIAQQVGASPEETQQAINTLVPTLLSGLEANAQDPSGEQALMEALQEHDGSLVEGGVDPSQIDVQDGEKIARHIFGANQDAVVDRLAVAGGGSSSLLSKLLPILAPIVLSFIASQVMKNMGGGAATQQAGGGMGGGLGSILGSILGGSTQQPAQVPPQASQGGLGDILGSILGGGQSQQTTQAQQGGGLGDILGSVLGGGQQADASVSGAMPDQANVQPTEGGLRGPNDVPAQQQSAQPQAQGGLGGILGGVLGDLLGGGTRR
ncbi:hypothetical protein USB125703_00742 [Pseudoclavibacter triregionum]|nr:hypothetical protein USB125703_00742 [Pseudoclavibacter triregionum]